MSEASIAEAGTSAAGTIATEGEGMAAAVTPAPASPSPAAEPAAAAPTWPADWREQIASAHGGEDKKAVAKELRRLQRFADPAAVYGTARALESRLSEGGLVKIPGRNASVEEVAAFRRAMGVPETPSGYFDHIRLDNGAVLGEADRPVVDGFAAAMHEAGAPAAVVNRAINWYFAQQEAQAAALDEGDDDFRRQAETELKESFGPGYRRRVNAIGALFASAPGGADAGDTGSLFARLMGGRMADGKIIGNDPDMVRFLVGLAREINPAGAVTEGGNEAGKGEAAEIAEIEALMRKDRRAYDRDPKMQARYRELLGRRG
jgi:hypothetical protein